ncbi:MAG: hypothetical protein EA385_15240 [Salinarimonadaceae bacterium]|nr:MAG: hypothetical protein EA385_15240 [Salinarimonadaceae bacterium]
MSERFQRDFNRIFETPPDDDRAVSILAESGVDLTDAEACVHTLIGSGIRPSQVSHIDVVMLRARLARDGMLKECRRRPVAAACIFLSGMITLPFAGAPAEASEVAEVVLRDQVIFWLQIGIVSFIIAAVGWWLMLPRRLTRDDIEPLEHGPRRKHMHRGSTSTLLKAIRAKRIAARKLRVLKNKMKNKSQPKAKRRSQSLPKAPRPLFSMAVAMGLAAMSGRRA